VGFLAVESDVVALDAFGAEDDPEGESEMLEDRPLLDVEFEVSGGIVLFTGGFGETVDFDFAAAEGFFEPNAIAVGARAVGRDRMRAGKGGGTEKATAETRAFFVGPIDETNGDGRTTVEFGREATENFETGEDVEAAVEPAAVGHRVEVTAEKETFFGGAGQRGPVVSGRVVVMLDRKLGEFFGEPFAGTEPRVGPGDALGAVFVGGEGAEFFEFGDGTLGMKRHGALVSKSCVQKPDIRSPKTREEKRKKRDRAPPLGAAYGAPPTPGDRA